MLVGIAGGSGSGKSTLAASIQAALGADRCALLTFDRYYRDLSGWSHARRAAVNFDHPDSLDDALFGAHLDALAAGRAVNVPIYDFATHARRAEVERVEPRPVVVADGILLLAVPHLAERLEIRLFVDAPDEVRLSRRIARDAVERGRSEASVRAQWAATVAPMHREYVQPSASRAELVVSGEVPFGPAVEAIGARVEEALQTGFGDP